MAVIEDYYWGIDWGIDTRRVKPIPADRLYVSAIKPEGERMAIKGNNLKAEMIRADKSLADLGEMLGIGKHAVEAYCDDMTTMPVCVLWQVARIFHCSTDWLLGMSNEREPKSPSRW